MIEERTTVRVIDDRLKRLDVRVTVASAPQIVEHHVVGNGDVHVLTRDCGGDGVPVEYKVAILMPVDDVDTSSFDNPLYLFPRAKRPRDGFRGEYRVIKVLLRFAPGRHRGMVREARRLLWRSVHRPPVDWTDVKVLDGVLVKSAVDVMSGSR